MSEPTPELQLTEVTLGIDEKIDAYFAALDNVVALAAANRCGVRVTWYSNGDLSITATRAVKFGTVEELKL